MSKQTELWHKSNAETGQDHHLLVILKIKIRSSKNVILKIKDQLTKHCDLEDKDQIIQKSDLEDQRSDHPYTVILKIKIVKHSFIQ